MSVAPQVLEAEAFVCEYFSNLELSLKKNTILLALSFTALLSSLHSSVLAQQSIVPIDSAIRRSFDAISSDPRVSAGLLRIEAIEAEMVREQFRLTEIPAPPFKEEVRAAYYLTLMQDRGLEDAYIDSEVMQLEFVLAVVMDQLS